MTFPIGRPLRKSVIMRRGLHLFSVVFIWLALVGVAWSLPQVLLMLLSGALADRFNRRRLMIAGDLIRSAAIATSSTLPTWRRCSGPTTSR